MKIKFKYIMYMIHTVLSLDLIVAETFEELLLYNLHPKLHNIYECQTVARKNKLCMS